MTSIKNYAVLGVASGIAATDTGCADGPSALQNSIHLQSLIQTGINLQWQSLHYPDLSLSKIATIAKLNIELANQVSACVSAQNPFIVFGGDHSCAIGTWSGASHALKSQGQLGLIWIDAHMDSHTPQTTESGAIHGMPVAVLLGYGDAEFTNILNTDPKVLPENIVLIGVRSFEAGEAELIKKLNIRVYFMDEIEKRGLNNVWREALEIVTKNTVAYGVTIDLDALDPKQIPGVGSPEPGGINLLELTQALKLCQNDSRLIGFEITEFNPHHDKQQLTEHGIVKMIKALGGSNE